MSQLKTWKIVMLAFFAASIVLILFFGPPSPAGRYEMKLPSPRMLGMTNAKPLHIFCQLRGGKVTVVSGPEIADFGSYQRTPEGWLLVLGREALITNKVEPSWSGLKVTFMGSQQTLPRCVHFWK
jgi:hypothetical protein